MRLKENSKLVTLSDGSKLELIIAYYSNGRIAVYFEDIDGPYFRLSCNVDDVEINEFEFIVKSWSENENLWLKVKALFDDTGRMCNVGSCPTTPIWKLKPSDVARVFG